MRLRGQSIRAARVQISPAAQFAVGIILTSLILASLVRGFLISEAGFPLNDGGMFYVMVTDIQAANYNLPQYASYNADHIPFVYPPLTFYFTGIISDASGMSLLTSFRMLPLLASLLSIPAFFFLCRSFLSSQSSIGYATVAFALIPRSFDWEIAGGGMTRAFGFLFAILAVHQGTRLLHSHARLSWQLFGAFTGLTILSHPEMLVFVVIGHTITLASSRFARLAVTRTCFAASLTMLLTVFWLGRVISLHGLDPILSARASASASLVGPLALLNPGILNEPFFPVHLTLALAGAIVCVGRGSWALPFWVVALFLIDPRKAPTEATVPIAMLVGLGVSEVLLPLTVPNGRRHAAVLKRTVVYGIIGIWVVGSLFSFTASLSPLHALSEDGQASMAWVASEVPEDAQFAIVTGEWWPRDAYSEWFPALAGRRSVATVQGSEWLSGGAFEHRMDAHADLQKCGLRDVSCLEQWEREFGESFTYVVVTSEHAIDIRTRDEECCYALRQSLEASPQYQEVYVGRGATIFERRTNPR